MTKKLGLKVRFFLKKFENFFKKCFFLFILFYFFFSICKKRRIVIYPVGLLFKNNHFMKKLPQFLITNENF